MVNFGEFVKNYRIKQNTTLREFCRINELDPSNWSKIERGILSPPKSKEVLSSIAKSLNIPSGSEDFQTLLDLAAISQIPVHLVSDQAILDKLPLFFRTLRGEKPTRKELEKILKILADENE
ncbi:MAG: helix-turn-helix domain-containing protein [Calditrichaceae bacterium]